MFCVFVFLSSLSLSAVLFHSLTALINNSRLVLELCVHACVCVRDVHSPLRGQGVTVEPRGHSDNSLPPSLSPPYPSGLLLLAWLAALHQADTPQALCPTTPHPTNTHTRSTTNPPSHPPLWADRYSSSPFI